jgi:DNA polymerase-3 subunit delta'
MFFKDIAGQNELKAKLRTIVEERRISHAQLFEGVAGYGALPLALAYAQYISCTARAEDSCGVCRSCVKYAKLIHPDLHFVFPVNTTAKVKDKAVSDNFIAEWRKIMIDRKYFTEQEWYEHIGIENKQGIISAGEADKILAKLNYKPFESDNKTMIIWLPERLNPTSANRLLKFIEEPPSNTLFILVTENSNNILPTIYSRTQRIKLNPLKEEDIVEKLNESGFDAKDVFTAARLSEGNYIKALQALQSSELTRVFFDSFIKLMRLAYQNKIIELITWAETMAAMGRERQKAFLVYAERMIRENFILNRDIPEIVYLGFEELEWAKKFSTFINETNVFALYEQFNICIPQISQNGNSKIIFTDLALKVRQLIRTKSYR